MNAEEARKLSASNSIIRAASAIAVLEEAIKSATSEGHYQVSLDLSISNSVSDLLCTEFSKRGFTITSHLYSNKKIILCNW